MLTFKTKQSEVSVSGLPNVTAVCTQNYSLLNWHEELAASYETAIIKTVNEWKNTWEFWLPDKAARLSWLHIEKTCNRDKALHAWVS